MYASRVSAEESYAIAMHGAPALPADFTHMPYANPNAPKGGRLLQGILGTFDSLNPLIVRGLAVQQIRGFVVESLMARGNDEAFTLYGLLARSVETDDIRSYVTFHLDPKARFSDGQPVLAEDVLFSWALLRDKGRPNHRQFYSKVAKAEALDPLTGYSRSGGHLLDGGPGSDPGLDLSRSHLVLQLDRDLPKAREITPYRCVQVVVYRKDELLPQGTGLRCHRLDDDRAVVGP